ADGVGFAFVDLGGVSADKPVELRTVADCVIRGRVIDTQGRVIAGAAVTVRQVGVYTNDALDAYLTLLATGQRRDVTRDSIRHLYREQAAFASATTDAAGRFPLA